MPVSTAIHLSDCVQWICGLHPRSVLDIGCGFGTWGFLCREHLDVWHGRVQPETWEARIDAIELFEPYIQAHQRALYSSIQIADIRDAAPAIGPYDLIIAGDVIEHLDKADAEAVLEDLYRKASKALLLNIPLGEGWDHPEAYGNPGELHRSKWLPDDFRQYPSRAKSYNINGLSYGAFLFLKDCTERQRFDALVSAAAYREDIGDTASATRFLEQARAIAPADPIVTVNLAEKFIHEGKPQEAIRVLEQAIEAGPGFHYAYLALARLLKALSHPARAREVLDTLLALPDLPEESRREARAMLSD